MDNTNLLKSMESEWKKLDHKDKLIQLGKLKMLEELAGLFDIYRESLTRELIINHCETEEDVLNNKTIKKNKPYQDPEIVSIENKVENATISA